MEYALASAIPPLILNPEASTESTEEEPSMDLTQGFNEEPRHETEAVRSKKQFPPNSAMFEEFRGGSPQSKQGLLHEPTIRSNHSKFNNYLPYHNHVLLATTKSGLVTNTAQSPSNAQIINGDYNDKPLPSAAEVGPSVGSTAHALKYASQATPDLLDAIDSAAGSLKLLPLRSSPHRDPGNIENFPRERAVDPLALSLTRFRHRKQSAAAAPSLSDSYKNSTQAIYDFSLSSTKPRLGLKETDPDFRSHYHDKKLVVNFKKNLERYLRTTLTQYQDNLSTNELFSVAFKHARKVFKKICLAPPDSKRSLLAAGMSSHIVKGFENRINQRAKYISLHPQSQLPKLTSMNIESIKSPDKPEQGTDFSSSSSWEIQSDVEMDLAQFVEISTSESLSADSTAENVPVESHIARNTRTQPVNYNLNYLSKVSKRGSTSVNTIAPLQRREKLRPTAPSSPSVMISSVDERQPNRASLLRARELGCGHLGFLKNEKGLQQELSRITLRDLRPRRHWTGAAKDIVTSTWAPDGMSYAVGSSTDMDRLNIQYNRPNNLLYGNLIHNTIYELPDHHINRPSPENDEEERTYSSVDSRLFTTVTSVCFSQGSQLLFSGSYDSSVKVWDIKSEHRPSSLSTVAHQGRVSLLSMSYGSEYLATAQQTFLNPIQVFKAQSQPYILKQFHPERSKRKNDLRLYPSALQWGKMSHTKHLLMAGFMENKFSEEEQDREGFIGIWEVEKGTYHRVTPNTQTVFDLAWCDFLPIFAAATTTGNRLNLTHRYATQSLVRVYSPLQGPSCVQEYECPAIDVNEICFHPQNEHCITASCTDGVTYMWDNRKPGEVLHCFRHGSPHDPLHYRSHGFKARAREREELDTGVRFVSWDEYGTELLTGSSDGIIKRWNPWVSQEDTFIDDVARFDSNIMTGQFSPDRSNLLIGLSKGSIQILSCSSQFSQIDDGGCYISSPKICETLTYKPAISPFIEDEFTGIHSSQELIRSGEISLHPVYGAGKGPSYQGPFCQGARKNANAGQLATTELDAGWLVSQLHPTQRVLGRERGGIISEEQKRFCRANNALSWARWQKFHPEDWREVHEAKISAASMDTEGNPARNICRGAVQIGSSDDEEDQLFWGGVSTSASCCPSPSNSSNTERNVHFQSPRQFITSALPESFTLDPGLPLRDEVTKPSVGISHASTSPLYGDPTTSLRIPYNNGLREFPFSQWRDPPLKALSPQEKREAKRKTTLQEAAEAKQKGEVLDVDEC